MEKENIWEWKRRGTEKGWRLVWEEKGRGKNGWGGGVEGKGKRKGLGSVREGKEKMDGGVETMGKGRVE